MRAAIAQGLHGTNGRTARERATRRRRAARRQRWRKRIGSALLLAQLSAGLWLAQGQIASAQDFGAARPPVPSAATNAPAVQASVSNQRRFALPFSLDTSRGNVASIQLLVSSDRGATWKAYDRQPAGTGQFVFQAPQDGEYWFSSQLIDSQNRATPPGPPKPERRVIIDTRQPDLNLNVQVGAAGEIVTSWTAGDPHLEPRSLKLEYRPEDGGTWQAVEIPEASLKGERGRAVGELTWWAKTQAQEITVRAEVVDAAGNRAAAHQRVVLPKVAARRALEQQHLAANPERRHPYSEIGRPSVGATPWNAGPPAGVPGQEQYAAGAAGAGPATSFAADRSTPVTDTPVPSAGPGELPAPRAPQERPVQEDGTTYPGGSRYQPANSRPQPPVQDGVRQPMRGLEELPGRPPALPDAPSHPAGANPVPDPDGTANRFSDDAGVPAKPAVTGRSQLSGAAPGRSSTPPSTPGSPPASPVSSSTTSGVGPADEDPVEDPTTGPDSASGSSNVATAVPTLDPENLPPGERPNMTPSKRFNLDYDIDAIDRRDVAAVELWATLDGGRTWAKWGSDPDRQSPFDVQVDEDGYYGFRVVIVARNGLASSVPQAGDLADLWVGVDSTPPEGEITSVTYGENEKVGQLLIQWRTRDAAPAERPIGLAFAASKDGPWTTMAAGLPDTGYYEWRADPDLPREIYLRLDIKDRAGNEQQSVLEHPIRVEGLRPKAKIHAIRPIGR